MRTDMDKPEMVVKVEPKHPRPDIIPGDMVAITNPRSGDPGIVYRVELITHDDWIYRLNIRPVMAMLRADLRRGSRTVDRDDVRKVDLVELGADRQRLDDLMRAIAKGTFE